MDKKTGYFILGLIVFLIIGILAFDVYVLKFGRFWEKKENISKMPTPINITTSTSSSTKTIAENVKADMKNFTYELIPTDLIPVNLVVTQQDVKNTNQYTFYGGSWKREDGVIFMPTIEYNQQSNIVDKQLIIYLPDTTANLNGAPSLLLTKTYTKIVPPLPFRCTLLPQEDIKSNFCESFWQDNNKIRKGINITSPISGVNGTQLFYCEHYPDTPAYSWKSCSIYFKDAGI